MISGRIYFPAGKKESTTHVQLPTKQHTRTATGKKVIKHSPQSYEIRTQMHLNGRGLLLKGHVSSVIRLKWSPTRIILMTTPPIRSLKAPEQRCDLQVSRCLSIIIPAASAKSGGINVGRFTWRGSQHLKSPPSR